MEVLLDSWRDKQHHLLHLLLGLWTLLPIDCDLCSLSLWGWGWGDGRVHRGGDNHRGVPHCRLGSLLSVFSGGHSIPLPPTATPVMSGAASLANAVIPLATLREAARRDLLEVLDSVRIPPLFPLLPLRLPPHVAAYWCSPEHL